MGKRRWFSNFCRLLHVFFKLGFTPWKAEQPLQGMELQEKEEEKVKSIYKSFLGKTQR